ncbi:MAG: metallophosphoesterase [Treponema sp.]|jgi:predicted phosphodiesterase|nr:metallophosphoesterase [Treponema sp.]
MAVKKAVLPRIGFAGTAALLIAGTVLLQSCSVDLFGLFASGDLDTRLSDKNTFNFLSPEDLSLSLPDEYSFIILNDTHIEEGDAHGLEKLSSVMNGAAFVVVNGDITQNGSRKDLQKFIEISGSLGVPCYPVIGNHDVYFNNWPVWKELIGSTCYRIDSGTGSTSIFVLDSAAGTLGSAQYEWLEEGLKTAKRHVLVFTHTNIFIESPADLVQFTDVRERGRLMDLLKGRSEALFMGHAHKRMVHEAGGVHYITVEDYRSTGIYCRVRVSPTGLSWEFEKL